MPFIATKQIEQMALIRFNAILDEMMGEFESHPVTVELMDAAQDPQNTPNISGTLGGYGNLFTFIGFDYVDNPAQDLMDFLKEKITIKFGKPTPTGLPFDVIFPTKEEIWLATPMPWATGRSWAKGIESGISGLGYYLHSRSRFFGVSRSGPAIQTNPKTSLITVADRPGLGGGHFRNTKYISDLLRRYQRKFASI